MDPKTKPPCHDCLSSISAKTLQFPELDVDDVGERVVDVVDVEVVGERVVDVVVDVVDVDACFVVDDVDVEGPKIKNQMNKPNKI